MCEVQVILSCRAEEDWVERNVTLIEDPLIFGILLPTCFDLDGIGDILLLRSIEYADSDSSFDHHVTIEVLGSWRKRNTLSTLNRDLTAVLVFNRPNQGPHRPILRHFLRQVILGDWEHVLPGHGARVKLCLKHVRWPIAVLFDPLLVED